MKGLLSGLALQFGLLAVAVSGSQETPLWVAIVPARGQEGRLIPIGRFQDDMWSNPWPQPDDRGPANRSRLAWNKIPRAWFGGAPVPPKWTVWLRDGSSQTVTVREAANDTDACAEPWTLRCPDLRGLSPGKRDVSLVDGVAFPSSATVGAVVFFRKTAHAFDGIDDPSNIRRETPETERQIFAAIRPRFEGLEPTVIEQQRTDDPARDDLAGLPRMAADRQQNPIVLETIERTHAAVDGSEFLHVSALRTYGVPADAKGHFAWQARFNGWLARDRKGALAILDASLVVGNTCCEWGRGPIDEAVAAVKYGSHTLLVMTTVYFEGERYVVLELKNGRLIERIGSAGAGC